MNAQSLTLGISEAAQDRCAYCSAPLSLASHPAASIPHPGRGRPNYCCYGCRVLGEQGHKSMADSGSEWARWWNVGFALAFGSLAMLLSFAANLTPPSGAARLWLHGSLIVASLIVMAVLGPPLARSAWQELRQRRVTMELLFITGIMGAFLASLHSTWSGYGAVYYEVIAILLAIYSAGKVLMARSRSQAWEESRKLFGVFRNCRVLAPDGRSAAERPVESVRAGEQVQVLPGEIVPVDGTIVSGEAFIQESSITGEPFPIVKRAGDSVLAGSFSEDGELLVRAAVDGGERMMDRLYAEMERAWERPSRVQLQADRLVRWFLPVVITVALGTFIFWAARADWKAGLFNALAVLLVACPCAMGLATPLAVWNALQVLATRGLVVRSGDFIEDCAKVGQVVFDKTGTLSEETLSMTDLVTEGDGAARTRLIALVRAVESKVNHPIASAFRQSCFLELAETLSSPDPAEHFEAEQVRVVPGKGVEGRVLSPQGEGYDVRIGSREWIENCSEIKTRLLQQMRSSSLDRHIYVEINGRLCGIAAFRERLRNSSAEAVEELQKAGIPVSVLTGDSEERAAALGMPNVRGKADPEAKAQSISKLKEAGRSVCFVGDGLNDVAALANADVGIVMAHSAALAPVAGAAVLHHGDLRVVPWAISVCRQVRRSIWSNLLMAAFYNLCGIILAATGYLHPVAAAVLMLVASFSVSARALRSARATRDCCGVERSGVGDSVGPREQANFRNGWIHRGLQSAPFIVIGPLLTYLGQLSAGMAIAVNVGFVGLGLIAAGFVNALNELRHRNSMRFDMLGWGSLGMLLGWWVDAGFVPVVQAKACLCCDARGMFGFTAMMGGMLLFGLPAMQCRLPRPSGSVQKRIWCLGVSALGMVIGMALGGYLALKWAGPAHPQQFLIAFAGMVLGMGLGTINFKRHQKTSASNYS